jgi:diguanylate cyclase (GGDEF)-like protein/PAS domain S-box-containing protein
MSLLRETRRGDPTPGLRDIAPELPATIEWSVTADGVLSVHGPVGEVLGTAPEGDLAEQMEAVLGPILLVLRSGNVWDDYQLERTVDSPAGPRRLSIHCRPHRDGSGGHVGVVMNSADQQLAEQSLGDLIERYRLLVEISPDMIVVHQDGVIRYMNPTGLRWMGADDASQLVGLPITGFVAPSSVGPLLERIGDLDRAGAISRPAEMVAVALDGRRLLLESQSVRTTWDGRPAFQVFLRDLSERRRAEAAVRYQANLLASVSDAVLATDLDGVITGWNPAAADLYHILGPEALGRHVSDVLGRESITDAGHVRAGEVEHVRADGSGVSVRVAVAPLRDEVGQPCGEVAVCADQSYRLLVAAEREQAENRFTTVVTALTEGIVVLEGDGTICSMNPAARTLLGDAFTEGADALAQLVKLRLVDTDGAPLQPKQNPVGMALATGVSQHDAIFGFKVGKRARRWLSISCEPLARPLDGGLASFVCSITDVTDRRADEARLIHAADHDGLTGVANRSRLLTVLSEYLAANVQASVVFVDLDRFKGINDAHGHRAGDRVLCAAASRIRRLVEAPATVARLAGDEFVIVMPRTSEAVALRTAEFIREAVARPIRMVDGRDVVISASIGIASTAANELTAEALLGDADMAMHRAKQRGRACIEVFDTALRAARSRRIELADRLRRAVAQDKIQLHYQPIIRCDTGLTIGYEALARWTDPELGSVPPDEFIPVAEDHGLIVLLGRQVLVQACRQAATWDAPVGGELPVVSVNLSAHQLSDPQLPGDVVATLALTGLPPERLCLEVTESVLMDDVTASIVVLNELRAVGVSLVIDDFGTGYSSLNYLRRLPVDGMKIDRSFVSELGLATEDDAIVSAIIQLGHTLGLGITAEGVETEDQAAILRKLGCDTAQGYLFGRPSIDAPTRALLPA